MKKWKEAVRRGTGDLALLAGAMLVSVGAGMIYLPAGLIAGGALVIGGAILHALGGGDEP